jgi:hypothetical protein
MWKKRDRKTRLGKMHEKVSDLLPIEMLYCLAKVGFDFEKFFGSSLNSVFERNEGQIKIEYYFDLYKPRHHLTVPCFR